MTKMAIEGTVLLDDTTPGDVKNFSLPAGDYGHVDIVMTRFYVQPGEAVIVYKLGEGAKLRVTASATPIAAGDKVCPIEPNGNSGLRTMTVLAVNGREAWCDAGCYGSFVYDLEHIVRVPA